MPGIPKPIAIIPASILKKIEPVAKLNRITITLSYIHLVLLGRYHRGEWSREQLSRGRIVVILRRPGPLALRST